MYERAQNFIRTNQTSILVGVVSLSVGFGVGYILGKKKKEAINEGPVQLEFVYPEAVLVEDEVVLIEGDSEGAFSEEEIEDAEEIITVENEAVKHNVFASKADDEWNLEEEVSKRLVWEPYIIHKDEFYADEADCNQLTLTYYAGDDILVDDEDTPIYNYTQVVGPLRFGHGSDDPNLVFVRNEKRHAEYEIIREEGLYSVEVLGLEIEDNQRVKHLNHSRIAKFRNE